ncbi:hypothetical protein RRG08_045587 [Elysia crispata]|uniref:Uncharacterized protein n=1 Tax=Elysia crispata TaxID=231223 RepID=A0AAE1ACK6_9GAST|nr:hypothetical protein RRG08_045587 [Elysia crispata]
MPLDQNIQHFEKIRDSRFYDSWTESQRSLGERSLCLVTLVTEIVLCFPDVMLLPARTSIFGLLVPPKYRTTYMYHFTYHILVLLPQEMSVRKACDPDNPRIRQPNPVFC